MFCIMALSHMNPKCQLKSQLCSLLYWLHFPLVPFDIP